MREIKFDLVVENKHTGSIYHKKYYLLELMGGIERLFDIENYTTVANRQYTGLKDKNGVEIYEGDVIKLVYIHDEGGGWKSNSNERGVVEFDSTWGVRFKCVDFTQRTAASHWKLEKSKFNDATDVEVIGNIYENTELLEAQDD